MYFGVISCLLLITFTTSTYQDPSSLKCATGFRTTTGGVKQFGSWRDADLIGVSSGNKLFAYWIMISDQGSEWARASYYVEQRFSCDWTVDCDAGEPPGPPRNIEVKQTGQVVTFQWSPDKDAGGSLKFLKGFLLCIAYQHRNSLKLIVYSVQNISITDREGWIQDAVISVTCQSPHQPDSPHDKVDFSLLSYPVPTICNRSQPTVTNSSTFYIPPKTVPPVSSTVTTVTTKTYIVSSHRTERRGNHDNSVRDIYLAVGIPGSVGLMLLLAVIVLVRRRRKRQVSSEQEPSPGPPQTLPEKRLSRDIQEDLMDLNDFT